MQSFVKDAITNNKDHSITPISRKDTTDAPNAVDPLISKFPPAKITQKDANGLKKEDC